MKTYVINAALFVCALLASAAHADDSARQKCKKIADMGSQIMTGRQAGAAMSQLMEVPSEGKLGDLLRSITIAAYEIPRYSSEDRKKQAVEDFHNEVYLGCIKS